MRPFLALITGLVGLLLHAVPVQAQAAEPTIFGLWEQTDPDGRVGSWFLIFKNRGFYEGILARTFPKPGEDPNPICTKCTGDQKDLPSTGLILIKGMQRKGRMYENGTILDPRDGTAYKATMELSPDGQKLTLRGFIGLPIFGKSQTWTRLSGQ
jgi:hypothetical protein